MNNRPRIGLVGCGRWGRHILRDLISLGCDVDVADPDPAARELALSGRARKVVDHVDGFKDDYSGYIIAAWTTQHGQLIERLAQRGQPIFCEKPLTCDADQADRVAEMTDGRLFVMHKWRYHPGVQALSELAQSGEHGAVKQILTRRLQWTTPHGDVDAIWSLAPHDLSMVYGILGFMPKPRAATGVIDPDGNARSLIGILGDDSTVSAVVHVAANWPTVERVVSVVFEEAVAVLDDPLSDHIKLYRGHGGQAYAKAPDEEHRITVSKEFPLLRELRLFIDYLSGGPPPMTDAIEGALIVRTLARLRALAQLPA